MKSPVIDHFRVPKTHTFKMRLGAQPFLWKWVLFPWEWKMAHCLFVSPQVAQARNIWASASIGIVAQHSKYKDFWDLNGEKPIVSETYGNERISIKNSLLHIKCVFHLSCVVHGPIYRLYCKRFINIQRNPFTVQPLKRPLIGPWTTQERCNTHFM